VSSPLKPPSSPSPPPKPTGCQVAGTAICGLVGFNCNPLTTDKIVVRSSVSIRVGVISVAPAISLINGTYGNEGNASVQVCATRAESLLAVIQSMSRSDLASVRAPLHTVTLAHPGKSLVAAAADRQAIRNASKCNGRGRRPNRVAAGRRSSSFRCRRVFAAAVADRRREQSQLIFNVPTTAGAWRVSGSRVYRYEPPNRCELSAPACAKRSEYFP
jgi:hypothetical protein